VLSGVSISARYYPISSVMLTEIFVNQNSE